ncbi:MAG: energy transducer TonB [Myxococcota bacterium]
MHEQLNPGTIRANAPRREPTRRAVLLLPLAFLLVTQAGCQSMWNRVRERERVYSLETARVQTQRGQCIQGLESLDRSEARLDLGIYAREAISARIRCYEKLGAQELATAHRRLLTDYYTDEPMALPEADGSSVFRVSGIDASEYQTPPSWLKITRPRYSAYAQRSKIIGRVVLSFELARNGTAKKVRVLEMPHPLLASWAIESVVNAGQERQKGGKSVNVVPGGQYLTTFMFEWRWADSGDDA